MDLLRLETSVETCLDLSIRFVETLFDLSRGEEIDLIVDSNLLSECFSESLSFRLDIYVRLEVSGILKSTFLSGFDFVESFS